MEGNLINLTLVCNIHKDKKHRLLVDHDIIRIYDSEEEVQEEINKLFIKLNKKKNGN